MEERQEKRTGKVGRFLGWLISALLMATLAAGLVLQYPRITQESREIYSECAEDKMQDELIRYMRDAYMLVDGMFVDWNRYRYGDEETAGKIILGGIQEEYLGESDYVTWYEGREESLSRWYTSTYPELLKDSGVKYFIYHKALENGCGTLDPLLLYEKEADYPVFVKITFNEYGIPVVKEERGVETVQPFLTTEYEYRMKRNQLTLDYSTGETVIQEGMLSDITVLLAVDASRYNALWQEISVDSWTLWEATDAMLVDYTVFVLAAVVIAVLMGLVLPAIRPLGLKEGWKAHIPLELLVLAGCIAGNMIVYLPEIIIKCQLELDYPGILFYWIGIMKDIVADGRATYVILGANMALWFAIFFIVYLCAINVRQLFAKGLVRFFKENTLTGRILFWLYKVVKKTVQFCGTIDFSNKGNRNFFLAVVLNFIVIVVLCCTWFFGILLAIPYSLFVFWLLQRWWNKIRTDYVVMLSTTEEMARGITDVEYVAEAGVFHELNAALSSVQEGFHTAVQEEVKSQKMKTELITNVSHDLKTPLTAIITYVDLLKNEALTAEERQEYVEVLERKSARLKTLIEDLFEISKATSGDIRLGKMDLDLVRLIQEVQMELEEEIMNSGITFKVNLPEEKVLAHLDAQKTCRIFENLTMNILKHGLTGSRAYISMEQTEKTVTVIYKNISAAEISYNAEEILERFTRGDMSRNTEGSGLGLAIVKSFTEAQGGKVKVDLEDDLFKVMVSFPKVQTAQMPVTEAVAADAAAKTE